MTTSLATLLDGHQHYHSTLQCRQFITAKAGVTPFGMLRQALRELDSRTWSVFEDLLRREELRLSLDELDEKLETMEDGPRLRRLALKRMRIEVQMEQISRMLRDRYREWAEFYAQAIHLRRVLGIAEGENLTPERREELEVAMFAGQFAATIRGRVLAGEPVPIPANLVESILTLPMQFRNPLLAAGAAPDAFLRFCEQVLPDPSTPNPTDIPDLAAVEGMVLARFEALSGQRMPGLLE